MKHCKKICFILGLCLALLLISLPVLAEEKAPITGTCGENAYWEYDEATATLTISGSGPMDDYPNAVERDMFFEKEAKMYPWYNEENTWLKMRHVVIEEGITSVGEKAFYYCEGIESVSLPRGIETVGELSLAYTPSLRSITFAEGPRVFKDAVFDMSGIRELIIPEGTERIEGHLFIDNPSITTVVFPNSMIDMGDTVFRDCPALRTVVLPNNLSQLPMVLIQNCNAIETLEFPAGTKKVGGIANCASLREVKIPEGAQQVSGFSNCPLLTEIEIPEGVTALHILAPIADLFVPYSVETLKIDPRVIGTVRIAPENPNFRIENGCIIENATDELIFGREATEIPASVKSIRENAFYGSTTLKEVVIPIGMTTLRMSSFQGCEAIELLKLHSGITYIWGMYTSQKAADRVEIDPDNERYYAVGSSILTKIAFTENGIDFEANTLVNHAAENAIPTETRIIRGIGGNAERLVIPEGVISLENWCLIVPDLKEIVIPKSVTTIHRQFYFGSKKIEHIYYAGSEEEWNAITFHISDFDGMTGDPTIAFWKKVNIHFLNGRSLDAYLEELRLQETTALPETTGEETTQGDSTAPGGCGSTVSLPWVCVALALPMVWKRKRRSAI